ncbi:MULTISPECIES: LysR family transcriptional regulator [unclassified Colwellia]|jgi:DNA-binding transcriptional LysR family regulator|uniref:LysR family transcriptional regulator n=1 Tax=unclassified Colwellia TaxID=196834 RepID=UPI0015F6D9E1|nr:MULTISPECIES: LysR family transcriptional regulator [unclassified Colwellia]MBA6338749.1 LysR family transcriptional regulator [Colwellia sp. BRX8-7]MBA6381320.1 LysR family transcriptional regulator [Colwellia sp. BRX10-7]MBA6389066.1 LysR family transcriptional regulator [Colwellia sp. BRX10-2]MBA6403789.1 LysR family transcriptional regulator [Colwellia sp. BRX10-5]MBA6407611.1 LysR family transcriptional regulator [Colwellia sp. BRX10-1]
MDLKSLNYFISVYELKSFSAAAKACFIAQPSISAAIAQLEQQLKVKLFIRHARGVTPSEQGKKLFPLAKQLLGQAGAIKNVFSEKTHKQPFNLGVTRGLGVERMSLLLKEFTSANPSVELTLVPHTENVDARIILKDELQENEQYIDMWHEDYLLAVPYDHIFALEDTVTIQQLDGLPFIQRMPCSAWDHLQDTLAIAGISLDVRAKITTIDYALGLVHAGLGCAFLPAHSEIIKRSDVVFRPIVGLQLTREIVLAYTTSSKAINNLKRLAHKHAH